MARYQGGTESFIKFSLDGLLRADINTRMQAYSVGLQAGYLTINDVRGYEDLQPIDDPSADTVRVPLANINVEASTLAAEDKKVLMAQRLVSSGYDPTEVLAALGLPAIAHTGVPPVLLQGIAQINPDDPQAVYEVNQ
jgi:hypothetical protein